MAIGREMVSGMGVEAPATGGNVELDSGAVQLNETSVTPQAAGTVGLNVKAHSGQTADVVTVHNAAGALVFTVRADGTLHGLTGGSVHFDL